MTATLAITLVLALIPAAGIARAEQAKPQPPLCTCPVPDAPATAAPRSKFAAQILDETDEVAALEAIRVALTEVGDGITYVWHRSNGRLSGIIRPTASFKDAGGKVCRHIELIMISGTHSGRIEGIACRLPDGRWQLDG